MTTTAPTVEPSSARSFCQGYKPSPRCFDEMLDGSGALRPHWQMFVNLLDDLGSQEIGRRWVQAKRLIHENGVTYNVYGDPKGMDRPWSLDTVPLLISPENWALLEAALIQRARLIDLILGDLYGPQDLLVERLLPVELVMGHPGFLRPVHGMSPPGRRWLQLYAADLGRSADGKLWVIGDRTQVPSGAGYALENRMVVGRALPDIFRDCHVQRLATYFRTFRETLASLAPHNRDNPRIVLLTPGPYNETYFEHAYLARYLGYTLVEGGDLVVRDDHVYLKTLGGLQMIDVILRRLDDDFCDPLEFRNESSLGVPGLLDAAMQGNVALANPLGSGLAESPALAAFLPALCRRLLGEEMLLDSVPTWWCGTEEGLKYVEANLPRLVIKPAFGGLRREPVFGEQLTQSQREDLAGRIRAAPTEFVAQEQLALSTSPVLLDSRLEPRHLVLRTHLVSTGDTYAVMPGGLARFTGEADSLVVSMQKGGGSKDVWVLAGGPVSEFSLLEPESKPVELSRGGGDLPSRVADNLFWLGKYVERAEGLGRLVRGIAARLADQPGVEAMAELPALFGALGSAARTAGGDGRAGVTEAQLLTIIFDETHRGSLKATLGEAHRVARVVRDRISIDTWRVVSRLDEEFLRPAQKGATNQLSEALAALDHLVITLAAFGGLAMESMTRGHGWRFLDMGRRTERALHTLRLLQGTLVQSGPRDGRLLEAILEIADSGMTYRRRYLTSLQLHAVLDLLVADESNPRSVAFQLVALEQHVGQLPRDASSARLSPEQQVLLRCLTGIRLADIRAESEPADKGTRSRLREFLGVISDHVLAFTDTVAQSYFSHATVSRQTTVRAQDNSI